MQFFIKMCKFIVFVYNKTIWLILSKKISLFQILINFANFSEKFWQFFLANILWHTHLDINKCSCGSKSTFMPNLSSIWRFLAKLHSFFGFLDGRLVGLVCKQTSKFGSRILNIMKRHGLQQKIDVLTQFCKKLWG